MQIRMTIGDASVTGTLVNTDAARDFASLLPLTLALEDYASTEKIAYLPRKLVTGGAPKGIDPDVGDIAYYAPWGTSRSTTVISAFRRASSGLAGSTAESRSWRVLSR